MKFSKKIMLSIALLMTGLIIECQQINQIQEDQIALNIVKAMQDCIDFDKIAQIQIKDNLVQEPNSLWEKATELYRTYISALREKHANKVVPKLSVNNINPDKHPQNLIMQMNEYKFTFENLLNEYIIHLGQLYEKKSGLLGGYKTNYYISSRNDQAVAITPSVRSIFLEILYHASNQSNWGNEINLDLLSKNEDGSLSIKNLKLDEIIKAIEQVPLPINFYNKQTIDKIFTGAISAAGSAFMLADAYENNNTTSALAGSILLAHAYGKATSLNEEA